jgi:hypothetical protein
MDNMDAIKGKWLSNGAWVLIVLFFSSGAMLCQSYIDDIASNKKHAIESDARRPIYDKIILEQGKLNVAVSKDITYIKKTIKDIKEQLIRLKIVNGEEPPSKTKLTQKSDF